MSAATFSAPGPVSARRSWRGPHAGQRPSARAAGQRASGHRRGGPAGGALYVGVTADAIHALARVHDRTRRALASQAVLDGSRRKAA